VDVGSIQQVKKFKLALWQFSGKEMRVTDCQHHMFQRRNAHTNWTRCSPFFTNCCASAQRSGYLTLSALGTYWSRFAHQAQKTRRRSSL